jgi:hypothetical protein
MNSTKYTVNARLVDLQSRCTALEAENKELRVHLAGRQEMLIGEAERRIQDELYATIRTLRESIKDGRDGVDGATGAQGAKGERGDCLIPNDNEVAASLLEIRQRHARFLATIQAAMEANGKQPSRALKRVIDGVLTTIENSLK